MHSRWGAPKVGAACQPPQLLAPSLSGRFQLENADVAVAGACRHATAAQRLEAVHQILGSQGRPPKQLRIAPLATCR